MAARLQSHSDHSATEYHLSEEETDGILMTIAFRWGLQLDAGIAHEPGDFASIYWSIAASFRESSNAGLGPLQMLPPELLHDILFRLDMLSLFKFRQVSRRSREVVDSLPQYQRAANMAGPTGGIDLFWALFRTGLAADVTLLDFDAALCTANCAVCGKFAPFLSLLLWKRVCFDCITTAPHSQVKELEKVQRMFDLTESESEQLKSIKTIPGSYGPWQIRYTSSVTLVSAQQVWSVVRQRPELDEAAKLNFVMPNSDWNFLAVCKLPYYDRQTGKFEVGLSCTGCNTGCLHFMDPARRVPKDKLYTREGFIEHFQGCHKARSLWKAIKFSWSTEFRSTPHEV
ncbi:hypothetical protein F5Y01DRAFT_327325 [Xylaria sp. FL0043]|nr:hypothetical protein F5Y01DRAFT_327325 [Xylaria sp. FL0043]